MLTGIPRIDGRKQVALFAVAAISYSLLFGLLSTVGPSAPNAIAPETPLKAPVTAPLYFVPESDTPDNQVRFSLRHPAGRTFFTPSEVVTSLRTESA